MNHSKYENQGDITDQLVGLLEPSSTDGEYTYSSESLKVIEKRFQELAQSNSQQSMIEDIRDLSGFLVAEGKAPSAGQSLQRCLNRFFPKAMDAAMGRSSIETSKRRAYGDLIQGPRNSLAQKFEPIPQGARLIKAGFLIPIAV